MQQEIEMECKVYKLFFKNSSRCTRCNPRTDTQYRKERKQVKAFTTFHQVAIKDNVKRRKLCRSFENSSFILWILQSLTH